MNDAAAEPTATPLDTLGLFCARAVFVAVLVGLVEGIVVSRVAEVSVSGIGIASGGLWIPAALLFLFPASLMKRVPRRAAAFGLAAAFLGGILVTRATHISLFAEAGAALGLAYAASLLELEPMIRRPIAIAGIVLAVALQVYAAYWVDAHRAFASLLVDHTTVPRFMLRSVLRRFV